MKRMLLCLLFVFALSLAIVGCGKDDKTSGGGSTDGAVTANVGGWELTLDLTADRQYGDVRGEYFEITLSNAEDTPVNDIINYKLTADKDSQHYEYELVYDNDAVTVTPINNTPSETRSWVSATANQTVSTQGIQVGTIYTLTMTVTSFNGSSVSNMSKTFKMKVIAG